MIDILNKMISKAVPEIREIKKYKLPSVTHWKTAAGTQLYFLPAPESSLAKIQIVIDGGRHAEHIKFVSKLTSFLLKEGNGPGNQDKSSFLEYYGASLKSIVDLEHIGLKVVCLSKHLAEIIPFLIECLNDAHYEEKEVSRIKRRALSVLKFDEANNETLSYRRFTQQLYGIDHPYGYNSTAQDIEAVEARDVTKYYQSIWFANNIKVFICGNVPDKLLLSLESLGQRAQIGKPRWIAQKVDAKESVFYDEKRTGRPGQASIKLGRRLFERRHPDYLKAYIYNAALGGFFGSLLSRKIREEDGLTYGIYSHLDTFRFDGIFTIGTEVNPDNVGIVLERINDIMVQMQQVLLPQSDLFVLKNYIRGYFLSILDGAMNQIEVIESLAHDQLDISYIDELFDFVQATKSSDIRAIAQQYFDPSKMSVTVVRD